MTRLTTQTDTEEQLFADFKRKLNLEAAAAQVAKLEYDMTCATTEKAALRHACQEANRLKIGAICVLPAQVKACENFLGSDPQTSLIACISFPHGGDTTAIKVAAVKRAIKDGVDEVEVCAPIAYIKDGNWSYVKREFKKLKSAAKYRNVRIDAECGLLTAQELTKLCSVAADCGITSVRTSHNENYDASVIGKMKTAVKDKCTIKASGVRTLADMDSATDMGAGIIGSTHALDLAELILKSVD